MDKEIERLMKEVYREGYWQKVNDPKGSWSHEECDKLFKELLDDVRKRIK